MKVPKYKIGDICVAYNDAAFTSLTDTMKYNGEECTVVDLCLNRTFSKANGSWEIVPFSYSVQFGDGEILFALEHELRRKEDDDWVKQKVADLCFPMPIEFFELQEA